MPDFAAVMRHIRELREDMAELRGIVHKPGVRPSEKTTDMDKLNNRLLLHVAIRDTFSEGELRLLVAKLGDIAYGDLGGDTHSERCLSLALLMQRHGRFGELLAALSGQRPHVDWMAFA